MAYTFRQRGQVCPSAFPLRARGQPTARARTLKPGSIAVLVNTPCRRGEDGEERQDPDAINRRQGQGRTRRKVLCRRFMASPSLYTQSDHCRPTKSSPTHAAGHSLLSPPRPPALDASHRSPFPSDHGPGFQCSLVKCTANSSWRLLPRGITTFSPQITRRSPCNPQESSAPFCNPETANGGAAIPLTRSWSAKP